MKDYRLTTFQDGNCENEKKELTHIHNYVSRFAFRINHALHTCRNKQITIDPIILTGSTFIKEI